LKQVNDWLRKELTTLLYIWRLFRRKKEKSEPNYCVICILILLQFVITMVIYFKFIGVSV